MTQHAAMTRLNARAEPHTAASRHCPATSASAYRIRRHRFASGGGSFGAGRPPSRLARVARRIAVVSLRATATATSSNTRHRVSDASRPIQFATDAGHANANPAATRGSANATAPLRFAVCAATTHTRNMSSTRNALRSRRARRRARRASGKPSMREERFAIRDVFGKGATERAHVSATSAACALSDAAPSSAASARAEGPRDDRRARQHERDRLRRYNDTSIDSSMDYEGQRSRSRYCVRERTRARRARVVSRNLSSRNRFSSAAPTFDFTSKRRSRRFGREKRGWHDGKRGVGAHRQDHPRGVRSLRKGQPAR